MPSRCDLHVHSKASDRPSEWYLERIGAPESFTEPLEVYRTARARGMDFVTLTDHDTIDGALEIAHLPGAFLSCEVTAAFPEDGAPIHLLVWGITRRSTARSRPARATSTRCALPARARPRPRRRPPAVPGRRPAGIDHLEKLLLLFRRFENLNGTRDPRATELSARWSRR